MKRLLRLALFGLFGLVLIVGAVIVGSYWIMAQSVAPVNGEANLAGLSSDVSIVRDPHGVPHIEAQTHEDALRALGWVHASERIWQMEVLRMAGQGRLSEMFGEQTVSSDRFLKTINMAEHAKRSFDALNERDQKMIQAYVDGVNSWIKRQTRTFEPSLPIEFVILGHKPELWQNWQPLLVLKVMALTLDANMKEEIGRLALAGKGFDPQVISEIYGPGPISTPPALPDLRVIYGFSKNGKLASKSSRTDPANVSVPLATAPWQLQLPASNNWAISGSRTESGKPLLANDPHLGFTAPSVFYLAHLSWKEGGETHNLIGGSLPGTPSILSGRNDNVAWGLTTTYLDSQDLFLEKINPKNPEEYLTENGYEKFSSKEVTIKVNGGDDVTFIRRSTRHGPVLPDGYKKLKERLPDGHVAALSWTALTDDDTTMGGSFDIASAKSVDDFVVKTRRLLSPMQSIVVADTGGKIGLIAPGRVPVRLPSNLIAGRAPVPGWDANYQWQGFLDRKELPMIIDPPSGAVATANANWLPDGYKPLITYDWAEHYRQDRVNELFVSSNTKQSMETMIAGQHDTLSRALMVFRDEGLRQIEQGVLLNEDIINALRQWDGKMVGDSPVPLILTVWHKNLQALMLEDDLGDDFELIKKGRISRILNILQFNERRDWCNIVSTPQVETCGDILFQSLKETLSELENDYGKDWHKWRWGDVHVSVHEHRPFTKVGVLSPFFTIRQKMDGGTYTLMRHSNDFSKEDPLAGMHGSALRTIYDFDDLEKSIFIISTGESGNVFSSHYDDLTKKWGAGEYIPMVTKPETYRKTAKGTFVLQSK